MTHQNLVLTEKAIKAHCKRLQKELKNLNKDLSLGETQNIFAKSLGFNNFFDLKIILKKDKIHPFNIIYESFIKKLNNKEYFQMYSILSLKSHSVIIYKKN